MKRELLVIGGILIIAILLVLPHPVRFFDGDEWTLFFVTRNFSEGVFSIDRDTLLEQRREAQRLAPVYGHTFGGLGLGSYRMRPDGRFVVEKSPGYFLIMSQFKRFGGERLLNILLATLFLGALLHFGRIFLSDNQRMSVIYLAMFTPAALIMLYRPYMESFASYSFLSMGALYYLIADHKTITEPDRVRRNAGYWLLAGLLLGMAIFIRAAIAPTVLLFGLHFVYRFIFLREINRGHEVINGLLVLSGILFFAGIVLYYNAQVNGSPFTPDYALGKPKQSIYCFSFQRLFYDEPFHPIAIIVRNVIRMPELLLNAYPLLLLAIPGIPLAYRHFRRDIFFLIVLWFVSIYALYFQFLVFNARHFMVIGRLYLPAVTPLAILSAFTLDKLGGVSRKLAMGTLISLCIISYLYFLCQIHIDPYNLRILDTFDLKNWISYE